MQNGSKNRSAAVIDYHGMRLVSRRSVLMRPSTFLWAFIVLIASSFGALLAEMFVLGMLLLVVEAFSNPALPQEQQPFGPAFIVTVLVIGQVLVIGWNYLYWWQNWTEAPDYTAVGYTGVRPSGSRRVKALRRVRR